MGKWKSMLLVLGAALALLAGACGDDGGDVVSQACGKAQECNLLPMGRSVQSCVEGLNLDLNQRIPTDIADWKTAMSMCLQFQGCAQFGPCAGALVNW